MAVQPKLPSGKGAVNTGAMRGGGASEKFDSPIESMTHNIKDMGSLHNDIGEKSGFQVDGYIVKKGTPFGEAAKFNFLPPGMDITRQELTDQRNMPLKKVTSESYQGDGWEPSPRDTKE